MIYGVMYVRDDITMYNNINDNAVIVNIFGSTPNITKMIMLKPTLSDNTSKRKSNTSKLLCMIMDDY